MKQTAKHTPIALPLAPQAQRTVHTHKAGVVKTRFVLHPSHRQLGEQIDALNQRLPQLPELNELAAKLNDPHRRIINRAEAIAIMADHPHGITARDLCQKLVQERVSQPLMQRLYALLAREVDNGLVEPATGRGALRRLTARGLSEAQGLRVVARRQREQAEKSAREVRSSHQRMLAGRSNSVFEYARTVGQGAGAA